MKTQTESLPVSKAKEFYENIYLLTAKATDLLKKEEPVKAYCGVLVFLEANLIG